MNIPLEILNLHEDGFHLLVEVVVYGRPFKAVLDTGASKTVFDKTILLELIREEDLLSSDKLSTGLGTNSMESFTVNIMGLMIGNLQIENLEATVLDLTSINNAYETMELQRVIGVIGGDILMKYKAIIDYEKLTLRLLES
jgi:predicted aspartyl protease